VINVPIQGRLCSVLISIVAALWSAPPADGHFATFQPPAAARPKSDNIGTIEKEMAAHPLDSFAIARREAEKMGGDRTAIKRLFATAARLQEAKLALLTESQLDDLVQAYATTLGDPKSAEAVQRKWLRVREKALGPADGPGRLKLAQLYHQWLSDRDSAARLCQEAFRVVPDFTAADRMLRDELSYEKSAMGWRPKEETTLERGLDRVKTGMTSAEVLKLIGKPARVSRQVLYRRYREQWFYNDPPGVWIDFDCFKGQDAPASLRCTRNEPKRGSGLQSLSHERAHYQTGNGKYRPRGDDKKRCHDDPNHRASHFS